MADNDIRRYAREFARDPSDLAARLRYRVAQARSAHEELPLDLQLPGLEISIVKGGTYAKGVSLLREKTQEDCFWYQPSVVIDGRRVVRPNTFGENLQVRLKVFGDLKQAMEQGLEGFETGTSEKTLRERSSALWNSYFDSSTAHHYQLADLDTFKVVDVCSDFLSLDVPKNSVIRKPYEKSTGRSLKRQDAIYDRVLSEDEAAQHEWWRHWGSENFIRAYHRAIREATRILRPHLRVVNNVMGIFLRNERTIRQLGDHLRPVFVYSLDGRSRADGSNVIGGVGRFIRVSPKRKREDES